MLTGQGGGVIPGQGPPVTSHHLILCVTCSHDFAEKAQAGRPGHVYLIWLSRGSLSTPVIHTGRAQYQIKGLHHDLAVLSCSGCSIIPTPNCSSYYLSRPAPRCLIHFSPRRAPARSMRRSFFFSPSSCSRPAGWFTLPIFMHSKRSPVLGSLRQALCGSAGSGGTADCPSRPMTCCASTDLSFELVQTWSWSTTRRLYKRCSLVKMSTQHQGPSELCTHISTCLCMEFH